MNPTSTAPNYSVFTINSDGALTQVAGDNGKFETIAGSNWEGDAASLAGEDTWAVCSGDGTGGFVFGAGSGGLESGRLPSVGGSLGFPAVPTGPGTTR